MAAGGRAGGAEYAQRVNAAAELVDSGMSTVDAARVLAGRFAVSQRQARRYVDHASSGARVPDAEAATVFTVRLPASLAARVRVRARESGGTISALVAQALTEFWCGVRESALAGERSGGRVRVRLRPPRSHGFVGGLLSPGARASGQTDRKTAA
jgi:hypothetical protein